MTNRFDPSALRGLAVRGVTLGAVVAAFIAFAHLGAVAAMGALGVAIMIYASTRPARRGDFSYAAASAIVIPDWLGFVLIGFFLSVPLWVSDAASGGGGVHPSAWVLWPMAVFCCVIPYVGWRSESFALTLAPNALCLRRGWRAYSLPYAEIDCVRPWRRDLPRWMRGLVPFLLATGHPGPAGAVTIARPRQGIELVVKGQSGLVIETDALCPPGSKLLLELRAKGIDLCAPGNTSGPLNSWQQGDG